MEHLLAKAYAHPLFTDKDFDVIIAQHERIDVSKGTYLLEPGAIANAYYIVEKGLVRSYLFNYESVEITTGFAGQGEVVIEVASLFQRIPTEDYIQCISDCILWKISYDAFQELFHQLPAMREWGRAWMAYELYCAKKRATAMITLPASKRYLQLLEKHPEVLQTAPLKFIASYLGITDTSLSRIRKEVSLGSVI